MTSPLKRALLHDKVLFGLNGFLMALLLFFCLQNQYENRIFEVLANHVKMTASPEVTRSRDSILIKSLHLVHFLEAGRGSVFSNALPNKEAPYSLINPLMNDLVTGEGGCGSNSLVLARILKEFNIPVRIAQMKVGNTYGGHIVVEAEGSRGWVVLDPFYDLFFIRRDGAMASFADISADWNWYSQQTPAGYDSRYRYAAVRYTNWTKVPVLMPAVKSVMTWIIGREKTEKFSLRSLFLKKYYILTLVTLAAYILLCFFMLKNYLTQRFRKTFTLPQESALTMVENVA